MPSKTEEAEACGLGFFRNRIGVAYAVNQPNVSASMFAPEKA
jgi:hypothetical protein